MRSSILRSMSRKRKQSRPIRGRAMAGHHNAISIDDRKQFFDGLDHSAQRSSGRFVDHGIAAIGEKVAHDEHIARRQKNRDISVGMCRGLRQQAQLLCPDVQHDRRWAAGPCRVLARNGRSMRAGECPPLGKAVMRRTSLH
jgi:hypothetical protein